ncbi:MAG: hypothetical protein K9K66_17130 [Desulfarculaceae bacterium]|nr:hypothetical protein [Desulfarculaceae bacterium]MCF8074316.1 hypothetical protein [Desulfarculaceae bacterium]MCF8103384.1 hypothetical protein [Desulfarculaceae bacterium]MCF8117761.1 hypothetical protein [Desulfarculaceae bacterium]
MEASMHLISQMRAMLPVAGTHKHSAARRPRGRCGLESRSSRQRLSLTVTGQVDAMDLVEGLSREVGRATVVHHLEMDFNRAGAFDNLALSAVLVVLRNHAHHLCTVIMWGLAPWARKRIHQTGPENIMGREWALSQDSGQTRLFKTEAIAGSN